jgi:glucosamine--fructose-6-phosphate aminotransferase (isomerizing)
MMLHIEREINEQPDVIRRLIKETELNNLIAAIRDFDPTFVMIAARGTSDNAARYAQYAFGIHLKLPVALATPSVHTLYGAQPNVARALVIGISQSGSSLDVRQVIEDANQQGALTLSITNDEESPLAQASRYHIPLNCGEEISVAATKTYTAELTAIALLVNALQPQTGLDKLPELVSSTIQSSEPIRDWIQRYRYASHLAVIGRGYNYATAYEISLKVKELCYITSEEYSEADFRHGPIAVVQDGFPVIAVAPQGKTLPLIQDLLAELREKKAECLVISNDDGALSYAINPMPIPKDVPEWLSPVTAIIPGQIFAMQLALSMGHKVDRPTGLTKVTITR